MPEGANDKAEAFMTLVEDKIRTLLREFSDGKLNSEQFHILYERYSSQRLIAQQAMLTGDMQVLNDAPGDQPTYVLKDAHMGKATGVMIYLNSSGATIETLGTFNVSAFVISPVLTEFRQAAANSRIIRARVQRLEDKRWLLFAGGRYTTVVTVFRNEPSPMQMREMQRLHEDFETANQAMLQTDSVNANQLAFPFNAFIQRKLKR